MLNPAIVEATPGILKIPTLFCTLGTDRHSPANCTVHNVSVQCSRQRSPTTMVIHLDSVLKHLANPARAIRRWSLAETFSSAVAATSAF